MNWNDDENNNLPIVPQVSYPVSPLSTLPAVTNEHDVEISRIKADTGLALARISARRDVELGLMDDFKAIVANNPGQNDYYVERREHGFWGDRVVSIKGIVR